MAAKHPRIPYAEPPAPPLATLVLDFGYCCRYAFFQVHKAVRGNDSMALVMGVSPSTIKRWRRLYRAGKLSCEGCEGCLKVTSPKPAAKV